MNGRITNRLSSLLTRYRQAVAELDAIGDDPSEQAKKEKLEKEIKDLRCRIAKSLGGSAP